ncbi:MAG: J domain-containing protein, partial [Halomonadaceae bacterium]
MGIWEILGIAPTRDRAAIEQAYAQQRRFADPQLDPENWQRLQKAYDEALRVAAGEHKPQE